MKHWYALIVLLVLAIIIVAKPKPQADPYAELRDAADRIDGACCSNATLQFSLPEGTQVYSTSEAVCLRRNASVFCARCQCDVLPAQVINTTEQRAVNCTLTMNAQAAVNCS